MQEKDFYVATEERKPLKLSCPFCRESSEYPIRWQRRMKRDKFPGGGSAEDRQRFAKARSHMVRVDDKVTCVNNRCRRTFEIPSLQSVVLL